MKYFHLSTLIYGIFSPQNLNDPIEKLLYEKRIKNKGPNGTDNFFMMEEGVRKLQSGLFAFHFDAPIGYSLVIKSFTEHEKCDLRELPFGSIQTPYLTMRKHTPFKELFRIL